VGYFSNQLLAGARNCVLNCGGVKAGDHVLILNLIEDHGNPADELAVQALEAAAQFAGARVQILWATGMEKGWWDDVPRTVVAAFGAADVVINNTISIGRPLRVVRDLTFRQGVVSVRNMASTVRILGSDWARFPYELSDEITRRVGVRLEAARQFRVVHSNGTDLTGTIGRPSPSQSGMSRYDGLWRDVRIRPFPLGPHVPVTSLDAGGLIVADRALPWEARRLGVPERRFSEPLRITVEGNRMTQFEGGPEAERFRRFYEEMGEHIGEDAWNVSSWHAGTHPKAKVYYSPDENPDVWGRGEHNNPNVFHFHLGGSKVRHEYDYPYMFHVSVEMDRATVFLDGEKLYDQGRLTVLDDPDFRAAAREYGDPDELFNVAVD
jgi:hypothetical protein